MSPRNSDGNAGHGEERPVSIVDSSRPMMADGRVDVKKERTVEQRGGEQSGAMGGTMGSLLSLLEAASIMANLKSKSKEEKQCASTTTHVGKRRAAEEVKQEGGKKKAKVARSVPVLPTPRTQRAKNSAPAQPAPAQPKARGASAKKRKKSSCSGSKRAAAPGECASVTCVCGYFHAIAWDSRHGRPSNQYFDLKQCTWRSPP